jgi:DNA-binding NarL/FixJ family response regulator
MTKTSLVLEPTSGVLVRGQPVAKTIRVLVVDDHAVVRQGLQRMLERDKGIKVVGEASNGEEAVSKAMALLPDVITMDLKMPGMDGITATREIKQKTHGVNILMLTLYSEDFVREAIEAGASGYMLKDSDCEQLIQAIHQVYDDLCPIAPSLTRELVSRLDKLMQNNRVSVLTRRQTEILKSVSEGANGKEIAVKLFISPATVKREIRKTLDKLGVKDRAQAVSEAMKQKLI